MSIQTQPYHKNRLLLAALAALLVSVVSGFVFAAWVNNGPQIILSLGSSALAWCF